jgi:hypothetical protein
LEPVARLAADRNGIRNPYSDLPNWLYPVYFNPIRWLGGRWKPGAKTT